MGREEAGKFLILIDTARDPHQSQSDAALHFGRASDHLAKLIYAQMADYSIASRTELFNAVQLFRPALRLDGPNDYDWVFPNELISERESAMYVDLAESEGRLRWQSPYDASAHVPQKSLELIAAIDEVGLSNVDGLHALRTMWRDFDHDRNSNVGEWWQRTGAALHQVSAAALDTAAGDFAVHEWPMPMTKIDVALIGVKLSDIEQRREAHYQEMMAREHGWD